MPFQEKALSGILYSGFLALPGGCRYDNGPFNYLSTTGYWWGDTEFSASTAYGRYLDCDYDALYRYSFSESNGFSVMLVRD